jgi:hypothetical protein
MADETREPPVPELTGWGSIPLAHRWFFAVTLLLLIVIGAGNLLSGYMQYRSFERQFNQSQVQQRAQQAAAGRVVEAKLCATFSSLGAIKPPGGSPAGNPSRAYEQQLSAKLVELGTDIGCR